MNPEDVSPTPSGPQPDKAPATNGQQSAPPLAETPAASSPPSAEETSTTARPAANEDDLDQEKRNAKPRGAGDEATEAGKAAKASAAEKARAAVREAAERGKGGGGDTHFHFTDQKFDFSEHSHKEAHTQRQSSGDSSNQGQTLQLTDLRGDDSHLDRLPHAEEKLEVLQNSLLVVSSPYRPLCLLASQALCRADTLNSPDRRCHSATVDDKTLPLLQDAVTRQQTDLLVLHLAHPRLLESAVRYVEPVHTSGVKVIILAPVDEGANKPASTSASVWAMHTPAELMTACGADDSVRTALKASQDSGNWPKDERDLADRLADYIILGGANGVVRHLDEKQEIGSRRARALVEAAAQRRDDGIVDLALLFVAACFPGIPIAEVDMLVARLLKDRTVQELKRAQPPPVVVRAGDPPVQQAPVYDEPVAFDYWKRNRREILRRNELNTGPGESGTTQLRFKHQSWTDDVARALDPWDLQEWMKLLHDDHLLLDHRISKEAVRGLINATSGLFVADPQAYNADWLVEQVRGVVSQRDIYVVGELSDAREDADPEDFVGFFADLAKVSINGQRVSDLLYGRFADLCWELRSETVKQFLDKLSSESKKAERGALALEIVLRLRSQLRENAGSFDAWSWLRHLLATAATETRQNVIKQLIRDAKVSAISTWQTLAQITEWLPVAEGWTRNDQIPHWAFSFLYKGFQMDMDEHFFVDDMAGLPAWSVRKELLLRWLTHPGLADAMDGHMRGGLKPGWLVAYPPGSALTLNGELCIAEMLDYWHWKHDPAVSPEHAARVRELFADVNAHAAGLPRHRKPPLRPERREIWLGFRALSATWGNVAAHRGEVAEREKYIRRRNAAYEIAEIFR